MQDFFKIHLRILQPVDALQDLYNAGVAQLEQLKIAEKAKGSIP
jgi:hypothetical protein